MRTQIYLCDICRKEIPGWKYSQLKITFENEDVIQCRKLALELCADCRKKYTDRHAFIELSQ